ncbi:MAG: WYL domain-containing protein [Actinobacteria bacterium]|nr:WYL domain-containing protein [Actinomycetota bacterium]
MSPSEGRGGRPRTAKASERLRRLLVLVPYVVRHPGARLPELARIFDATEEELVDDLKLLFVSGLPPYGPGDLIDVDVQDGRVWITMADYFSRPLRLTRNEALALYLRGTALAGAPGLTEATALSSALAKLEEKLGAATLGEVAGRVEAAGGGRPAETLEAVRRALAGHERLEIEYYATSTAETTVRRIDPEEVFFAIGNWYVVAWDHLSGEERLFRADRIRGVKATGERFEHRGLPGAGRPLYTPTGRDVSVRLLLGPAARWVAEYYETESEREKGNGSLEVVLPASRLEWVARLVLRLAGEARILDPPELKDRVRDLARRTLERYE